MTTIYSLKKKIQSTVPPFRVSSFPGSSVGKECACNAGDQGSIPGSGRSTGEGNGYPLQYSGLENTMDGVTKSQTWLSDFHFHQCYQSLSFIWTNSNFQIKETKTCRITLIVWRCKCNNVLQTKTVYIFLSWKWKRLLSSHLVCYLTELKKKYMEIWVSYHT